MVSRTRPEQCCPLKAVRPLSARISEQIARLSRALADPTRVEILRLIARQRGPVCACDVVGQFELSQPTISHHLKLLWTAHLLKKTRRGLWSFYELNPDARHHLAQLSSLLDR